MTVYGHCERSEAIPQGKTVIARSKATKQSPKRKSAYYYPWDCHATLHSARNDGKGQSVIARSKATKQSQITQSAYYHPWDSSPTALNDGKGQSVIANAVKQSPKIKVSLRAKRSNPPNVSPRTIIHGILHFANASFWMTVYGHCERSEVIPQT